MQKFEIRTAFVALFLACWSLLDGNANPGAVAAEPDQASPAAASGAKARNSMLYRRTAEGSIDSVVARLEKAVAANKFGVLAIHDLKQKLNAKGVEFAPECRIMEVCNPKKAKSVLEADIAISNALPCRISIYEEDGKVTISTLRPTAVLGLFGQPKLEPVAKEVEAAMIRIIDAACAVR